MRNTAVAKIIAYCYFVMHFMRLFYFNDSFFPKRLLYIALERARLCVLCVFFSSLSMYSFGHVIAIHYLLDFWSSSYFLGGVAKFLSIKSIISPFIAYHARNCTSTGPLFLWAA